MSYLDENGLKTFWKKINGKFVAGIGASTDASSYTINLLNGDGSTPTGDGKNYKLTVGAATPSIAGVMSSEDKAKLDGVDYNANNYSLPKATTTTLGGVIVGANLAIDNNGKLNAFGTNYVGTNPIIVDEENGTISHSADEGYKHVPSLGIVEIDSVLAYDNAKSEAEWFGVGKGLLLSSGALQHATSAGYKHIPTGGSSGNFLTYSEAGTAKWSNIAISNVTNLQTSLDAKAPLESPTFTGTPNAPTAEAGTSTTQIATTAFVNTAVETAVTGVASYGGTVASETELTSKTYKKGNYYVVSLSGTQTWDGYENGDMFFAKKDKGTSGSLDDFDAVQANITAIPDSVINALS